MRTRTIFRSLAIVAASGAAALGCDAIVGVHELPSPMPDSGDESIAFDATPMADGDESLDATSSMSSETGANRTTDGASGSMSRDGKAKAPSDDAGVSDEGGPDTNMTDGGTEEEEAPDTGSIDTGIVETGATDTSVVDAGMMDTGGVDTGSVDTGGPDMDVLDESPIAPNGPGDGAAD